MSQEERTTQEIPMLTKERWDRIPTGYKGSEGRGKLNKKSCFACYVPGMEHLPGTALVTVLVAKKAK